MSRQDAIDQLLGIIRLQTYGSDKSWTEIRPILEQELKQFMELIERESCPLA
jgi:hypothetical protein